MRETAGEDITGDGDKTDITDWRVPGNLGTGGGAGGSVRSEFFGFGLAGVEATISESECDYMRPICALSWARWYRGEPASVLQGLWLMGGFEITAQGS